MSTSPENDIPAPEDEAVAVNKVAKKATQVTAKNTATRPTSPLSTDTEDPIDVPMEKKDAEENTEQLSFLTSNNDESAQEPSPVEPAPVVTMEQPESQTPAAPARKGTKKLSKTRNAEPRSHKKTANSEEQGSEDSEPHREHGSAGKPRRKQPSKKKEIVLTGDPVDVDGLIELAPKGYGFLRRPEKGFSQARDDVFVPPDLVRLNHIRQCMWVKGVARTGPKGLQLTEITEVNGEAASTRGPAPFFDDLKAINPDKRISLETTNECFNTRILDLVSPIGRGQRGLIVAPPRSGKTTLLMDIAKSLMDRHEETIYPIFLLVDERPEEVTEFKRALPDIEMFSSSNDSGNKNHTRVAELCIERAKRLVEEGKHVFILMDSITRLARAYNRGADGGSSKGKRGGGKNKGYQSGGIVSGALEIPRRLFAAARNTREAGSLTILATALVQTNSKADEAIFQEFKGTGNMEIVLDRRLADRYIFPAVDIFKSGTRREELLLPDMTLKKFHLIRRGLQGHHPDQAMERLLFFLKKFPSNAQMLLEIKG